jgi:asparagine synthase (glutamine-hydrolysing)
MCGITGFFDPAGFDVESATEALTRMRDRLTHRGPDDAGNWVDGNAGIALGHRRLAILDLSPAGHQPMVSPCGRYVVSFNGEIYNHRELRAQLDSSASPSFWRGHSDTETLLEAIRVWGTAGALKGCVGMFAFALWDRWDHRLTLARDRLGEKPLYYGWLGRTFVFASELKAIRAHPRFEGEIDAESLMLYMRHNYVPGPRSIFKGISKLSGGTIVSVERGKGISSPDRYWSCEAAALEGLASPHTLDARESVDELERLLKQSVSGQMIADVPVGAFLSGGIDSSTVVALMQAQSGRRVKTFSIGFREAAYNEANHAADVAKHLGTEHSELYVTPRDTLEVVPRLPDLYDEPFADSSQLPTSLMMALARAHVTVALSGDGGDELFGGYNRYPWADRTWRHLRRLPIALRRRGAAALTSLSPVVWDKVFTRLRRILPGSLRYNNPGEKIHKLANVLAAAHPEAIYREIVSHWSPPSSVVKIDAQEPLTPVTNEQDWLEGRDFVEQMMFIDQITYLPDDILVKVDRSAMAVSLETRVPILDHRVVEFAWRVPLSLKVKNGQGKWLLRQVLDRYVPRHLVERPKMGFGVPIDVWLRGPLRDWAEDLLSEAALREQGYFDPRPIRKRWADHVSGRANWHYSLWCVLMFQAWLRDGGRRVSGEVDRGSAHSRASSPKSLAAAI